MRAVLAIPSMLAIWVVSVVCQGPPCLDACYSSIIQRTNCPDTFNPTGQPTAEYMQCVCESYDSGPLSNFLSCVKSTCNDASDYIKIRSFFSQACADQPRELAPAPHGQVSLDIPAYGVGEPMCPSPTVPCPFWDYGLVPSRTLTALEVMSEVECIDPAWDIESCGGCVSLGKGVSCQQLEGVKASSCVEGACRIYSCKRGYVLTTVRNAMGGKSNMCRMSSAEELVDLLSVLVG